MPRQNNNNELQVLSKLLQHISGLHIGAFIPEKTFRNCVDIYLCKTGRHRIAFVEAELVTKLI